MNNERKAAEFFKRKYDPEKDYSEQFVALWDTISALLVMNKALVGLVDLLVKKGIITKEELD